MSVYHCFELGCPDPSPVRADRFAALLDDLLESGIAAEPVWVLSGRISPDSPSVATLVCDVPQGAAVPRHLTDDGGTSLAVRYAGTDRDAIREAVRTAPFGVAGVEVVAAYFEVKFPDRPRSESWACDGTLFALAEPQWLVRVESFVVGPT